MGIGDFLFGSKDKIKKRSLLNKDQENALRQYFQKGIESRPLYNAGSSYLQSLLSNSPEAFQAFQEPYLQNFQQNIVPTIAERFAGGLGAGGTGAGGTLSSAFANSLAQQGRGLQTDLASLRGNMQLGGLGQALGYAQQPYSNTLGGLGVNSFQRTFQPGKSGFLAPIAMAGLGAASGGLGTALGGALGSSLFGGGSSMGGMGGGMGGFGLGNRFGF